MPIFAINGHEDGWAVALHDQAVNGSIPYRAEYYHKDHLGNVRLRFSDLNADHAITVGSIYDPTNEILLEKHYYPFGLEQTGAWFATVAPDNVYRYNGKEWDAGTGLYDYGARWYDPAVARWGQVDPLADSYAAWSPYNYVLGNPIRLIDPDGRAPEWIDNGDGTYTAEAGDSAFSLAKDAGISTSYANTLVESQLGANFNGVGGLGTGSTAQGGSLRLTNGAYNGNALSPQYYESGWTGGSRAQIKTYNLSSTGRVIGRLGTAGTVGLRIYDIGTNAYNEGGFGIQTQRATGRTAGSLAGGYGGAYVGAGIGALFGGFGAIPGGIIGGVLGGWGGSKAADKAVEKIQE